MVQIELPDLQNAIKRLEAFPKEVADFALTRTLNDVAKSGKAEATRVIFQRYYFDTQGPIQKGIKATTVNNSRQYALIRFQGTRFPVKQFLPTQTTVGVDIMEIRGQRSTISQAFGAAMQYGFGIFKRMPDAPRYPVRSITGLSIANMAREDKEVLPAIKAYVSEQLGKRLQFWLAQALAGNKAKYERSKHV
jgi:hypothetical protein